METDVDWLKMSWKWKSLSRENAGPPAPRCFCFSPPHLHLVASWSVSSQAHFPKPTLIRPSVASSPPGWPVFCQKKKKKKKVSYALAPPLPPSYCESIYCPRRLAIQPEWDLLPHTRTPSSVSSLLLRLRFVVSGFPSPTSIGVDHSAWVWWVPRVQLLDSTLPDFLDVWLGAGFLTSLRFQFPPVQNGYNNGTYLLSHWVNEMQQCICVPGTQKVLKVVITIIPRVLSYLWIPGVLSGPLIWHLIVY